MAQDLSVQPPVQAPVQQPVQAIEEQQECRHVEKIRNQKKSIAHLKNHLKELDSYAYKLEVQNVEAVIDSHLAYFTLACTAISSSLFAVALMRTNDSEVKNRLAWYLLAAQVCPIYESAKFAVKHLWS